MRHLLITTLALLAISAGIARADDPTTMPAGKLITLHLTDVECRKALDELQLQSGIRIDTGQIATRRVNRTRVTIDIDNQPFWIALALIVDSISLRPQQFETSPPSLQLVAQAPGWRMPYFAVSGPVAIILNRALRTTEANYSAANIARSTHCMLAFEVFPEPELGATQLTRLNITKCVDENGAAIAMDEPDQQPVRQMPSRRPIHFTTGTAKSIAEIRGEAVVRLGSGQDASFPFSFQNIPLPPLQGDAKVVAATTPLPEPTPDLPIDYAKRINAIIAQLTSFSSDERQSARIGLAMLPTAAFDALETAAKRKDLPPAASGPLNSLRLKQKSWRRARLKAEAADAESNHWQEKLALDAYARIGHRDPAWDQQAVDAIHGFFNWNERADVPRARRAFEEALGAGCDDPLVLSLAAYAYEKGGADLDTIYALYAKAGEGMESQLYPAIFRLGNAIRYSSLKVSVDGFIATDKKTGTSPDEQNLISRQEDLALALWPEAAREKMPLPLLKTTAERILLIFCQKNRAAEQAHTLVMASLRALNPGEHFLLRTEGHYLCLWAWQARSNAAQGMALYADRLGEAEKSLTKAYKLDPADGQPAADMLAVCLGRHYPRPVLEDWFTKAMNANPDDFAACATKLNYIRPAWWGTVAQETEFGDECFKTENWRAAIPFCKAVKYEGLSRGMDDPSAYFVTPEVWTEIREVYEPYLLAVPDDIDMRARYCMWACRANHWDVARKQFEMLGGYFPIHRFQYPEKLQRFRTTANRAADAPTVANH